jgi:hypothetical protein
MVRIFSTLAIFALLLLAAALVIGLHIGDIHGSNDPDTAHWAVVHRLMGTAAALVVVLVDSIVITYFIGTSRWCKEVAETYQLDAEFVRRSATLKRRNFPWSMLSILVIIGVAALGAAADPMSGRPGTQHWVNIHLIGALAGLAFTVLSFYFQAQYIAAHHGVINDIVAQVRRIRTERGLEV